MVTLGEHNTGRRILVAGDSWAYVHGPKGASLTRSYSEMLANWGNRVDVVAECGVSNRFSIGRIKEKLAENSYDLVIWTQTGPARDFRNEDGVIEAATLVRLAREWDNNLERGLEHHLVYSIYPTLEAVIKQYDVPVICMGGCSRIVRRIGAYPWLHCLIPSIPELLIHDHTDGILHDCDHWSSGEYADLIKNDPELIKDWMNLTSEMKRKHIAWGECASFFRPDVTHPNHIGHCVVAAKIQDYLQIVAR